jgi:hypothetical protein
VKKVRRNYSPQEKVAILRRHLLDKLQVNSKTREGNGHMDRDAQFQYIADQAKAFLAANEPVISVDTKKKELVGNSKTTAREVASEGFAGSGQCT